VEAKMIVQRGTLVDEPKLVLEEVTDPQEVARSLAADEQARRNGDWLQAHWPDLVGQAHGQFVAVAGQQAYVAETMEAASALARAAHPEDRGVLVRSVGRIRGPRIYANRR
jgi:hypothetical protein